MTIPRSPGRAPISRSALPGDLRPVHPWSINGPVAHRSIVKYGRPSPARPGLAPGTEPMIRIRGGEKSRGCSRPSARLVAEFSLCLCASVPDIPSSSWCVGALELEISYFPQFPGMLAMIAVLPAPSLAPFVSPALLSAPPGLTSESWWPTSVRRGPLFLIRCCNGWPHG